MMGFESYGSSPWMWGLGGLMMVLFWGGLILLAVWAVKTIGGRRAASSSSALEVLGTRLAAGEITRDEYEETRRVLGG